VEKVEPVYGLYYDALCLFDAARILDKNSLRKAKIIQGLYDALMGIHYSSTGTILEEEASEARKKIKPLLEAKNGSTTPEVHLIGHAHIDHAWLWHIGETERKVARTYINMAKLAEEYPEFIFIQTQSAQLEIIKREYPEIFEAVKEAYRKGNWEPNGGMWVEADCNITGSESLVRQFLVGKKAAKEMLGYEGDTLWLPDVFGYAAALPQILKLCRINYFVTSKINWNDTTRFPYETFIWRGIDGTGVKTHFLSTLGPGSGYNGRVRPDELEAVWNNVQHKEVQSACVKSIGEGDGGGGTARGDLEAARRLANLEGVPKAGWKKVTDARVAGRALPGTPPRHLHNPGSRQALQPQTGICPAERGVPIEHCHAGKRKSLSARKAFIELEAPPYKPIPRHHPRLFHRQGLRRSERSLPQHRRRPD